jgi:hypothetical protein
LNERFHFHCLITDGLLAPGAEGEAEFFEAADLDQTHIECLKETRRRRILRFRKVKALNESRGGVGRISGILLYLFQAKRNFFRWRFP